MKLLKLALVAGCLTVVPSVFAEHGTQPTTVTIDGQNVTTGDVEIKDGKIKVGKEIVVDGDTVKVGDTTVKGGTVQTGGTTVHGNTVTAPGVKISGSTVQVGDAAKVTK